MPMLPVPVPIVKRFDAILEKRAVAPIQRADYKKWLSASIRKYGYVCSGPKSAIAPSALSPEAINSAPNL